MADVEPALGAAGVAEIRQSQRGGVGQVEGALAEFLERQRTGPPLEEGAADGRGGTEQVGHQPAEAVDVANEPHVLLGDETLAAAGLPRQILPLAPEAVRHGEVEVDAGDHLHQAAVAVLEALAVERLHLAHVGAAVLGQTYALLVADETGHGERPEPLIADVLADVMMDVTELLHQALDGVGGRGNELQQALRVVCGDVGMGQGRAQAAGVIPLGQAAIRGDAQGLALQATTDPLEGRQTLRSSQSRQQLTQ